MGPHALAVAAGEIDHDAAPQLDQAHERRAPGEDAWTPRRPLDALLAVDTLKAMPSKRCPALRTPSPMARGMRP
ncbi:hypothetical protein [Streptomyces sp. NPDC002851]